MCTSQMRNRRKITPTPLPPQPHFRVAHWSPTPPAELPGSSLGFQPIQRTFWATHAVSEGARLQSGHNRRKTIAASAAEGRFVLPISCERFHCDSPLPSRPVRPPPQKSKTRVSFRLTRAPDLVVNRLRSHHRPGKRNLLHKPPHPRDHSHPFGRLLHRHRLCAHSAQPVMFHPP